MRAHRALASFVGGLALGAVPAGVAVWLSHHHHDEPVAPSLARTVSAAARWPSYAEGGRLPPSFNGDGPVAILPEAQRYSPFHDYPLRHGE